jgi:hypothetical protein
MFAGGSRTQNHPMSCLLFKAICYRLNRIGKIAGNGYMDFTA